MKNCCICKKQILEGRAYYRCSVSTCNKKSNPQSYCSVQCWDVHVPVMNHKNAWACEEIAKFSSSNKEPVSDSNSEILVVVSKVKQYIKDQSDCNTSAAAFEVLSDCVRQLCDKAMEKAKMDGRKTVMDRDFDIPFTH